MQAVIENQPRMNYFSLCVSYPKDETSTDELCQAIISDFEPIPYETPYITEEEFVYDALRNELLFSVLRIRAVMPDRLLIRFLGRL